jgi:hypothetical protein
VCRTNWRLSGACRQRRISCGRDGGVPGWGGGDVGWPQAGRFPPDAGYAVVLLALGAWSFIRRDA